MNINFSTKEITYPNAELAFPRRFSTVLEFYTEMSLALKKEGRDIATERQVRISYVIDAWEKKERIIEIYDLVALKALCFDYILPKLPTYHHYSALSRCANYYQYNRYEDFQDDVDFLTVLAPLSRLKQ